MAEYLGFKPTDNPFYYFTSYNSEDKDTISEITKMMMHSGINLWYDYGIDYGEDWEEKITEKIKSAQAVILFFTKGILKKKESYVQKEYRIAKFLKQEIYVVFVDKISNEEVPVEKIPWWLDIEDKQNINLYELNDISKVLERMSHILGIQTHENKMSKLIAAYNQLYFDGRVEEADVLLREYLQNVSLKGKVDVISNIINGGFSGTKLDMKGKEYRGSDVSLLDHLGNPCSPDTAMKIEINGDTFIIGERTVFHRWGKQSKEVLGDACVIYIWKNGILIHMIGRLVETGCLKVFYDSIDDIVYVSYLSDFEPVMQTELGITGMCEIQENLLSITTIEKPNDLSVCTDFKYLNLRRNAT